MAKLIDKGQTWKVETSTNCLMFYYSYYYKAAIVLLCAMGKSQKQRRNNASSLRKQVAKEQNHPSFSILQNIVSLCLDPILNSAEQMPFNNFAESPIRRSSSKHRWIGGMVRKLYKMLWFFNLVIRRPC